MLGNKYLTKLQNKCNLNENFMNVIYTLLDKLVEFGYISKYSKNKLSKRLCDNINTVIIGKSNKLDYKSGYYDALKKELYIKDINDTQALFLRLLYVINTREIGNNIYSVGYSKVKISNDSYKTIHSNFGINRAVISNLTCRLLYTLPSALSIMPTYRTYENNFLGHKIISDNDIYFLEGKLIRQICFVYGINEESFYTNLFTSNPYKYIEKLTNKYDFINLFELLDLVSRKYSNYNKLCYFNRLLTDNYMNIKKYSLKKDKNLEKYIENEKYISKSIKNVLEKMNNESENKITDEIIVDSLETSLSEKMNDLEDTLLFNIASLQSILIKHFINRREYFTSTEYVINLKKFQKMLVLVNSEIYDEIYKTISNEIIHANENTCTNMTEKIKYSLVNYMLGTEKYSKLFEELTFKLITGINTDDDIFTIINNGLLNEVAYIHGLSLDMKSLNQNTEFLKPKNLRYLLNTHVKDNGNIEKMFTNLKNEFKEFNNITIDNIYMYQTNKITLLLVTTEINQYVVLVEKVKNDYVFKMLKLSESYTLIDNGKNLPALYTKNKIANIFNMHKFLK